MCGGSPEESTQRSDMFKTMTERGSKTPIYLCASCDQVIVIKRLTCLSQMSPHDNSLITVPDIGKCHFLIRQVQVLVDKIALNSCCYISTSLLS